MKLKSLRDQLESFIALKVPNYAENSAFQGSFRVSTAKPYDLNFTYNDFNKKNKEESGKKIFRLITTRKLSLSKDSKEPEFREQPVMIDLEK
jgi:hypothetical protein